MIIGNLRCLRLWWIFVSKRGRKREGERAKETTQSKCVERNIWGLLRNHFCSGKTKRFFTFWTYVFVAFGIQHAMSMWRVVLSPVACPALHCFSTLSYKRHNVRKRVIEHKMCVFFCNKMCFDFLYNFSKEHFSLRWKRSAILTLYRRSADCFI